MSRKDLVDKFLNFEEDNNLVFDTTWQYMRMELFRYIEDDLFNTLCIPIYIRQPIKNFVLPHISDISEREIIILNTKNRFVTINKKTFCPATGGVKEYIKLGQNELSFDFSNGVVYVNDKSLRGIEIDASLYKLYNEKCYSEIIEKCCSYFCLHNIDKFKERAFSLCKYVYSLRKHKFNVIELLKASGAKYMFVNGAYNPVFRLFIEVANEMDIISCEMQHGYIHQCHVAYNTLKRDSQRAVTMPRYLAVYTDQDKKSARYFQDNSHIIPIGNFCFEKAKKINNSADSYDFLFVSATNSEAVKKYAISFAKHFPTLKILYRFHPEERVDDIYLSQLNSNGIKFEFAKERSVYLSINECQNVVTYNSTVTFEALYFKKNVFVITDDLIKIDESIARYVTEITDPAQLIEHIDCGTAVGIEYSMLTGDYESSINSLLNAMRGEHKC